MEEIKFIIVTSFAVISIICCLFGFIEKANELIFIGLAISPIWIILPIINTSNIYAKQNYLDFLKSQKIKKSNPDVQQENLNDEILIPKEEENIITRNEERNLDL